MPLQQREAALDPFDQPIDTALAWYSQVAQLVARPSTLFQAGLIAAAFVLAFLGGRLLEPRLEDRLRQVRERRGLLRFLAILLRRLTWLLFPVFLWIEFAVLRVVTWPSRSYLIGLVATLATAWIVIAVAGRTIRNRFLARVTTAFGLALATILILGLFDETTTFLDSVGISIGDLRLTLLSLVKAAMLLGIFLWAAKLAAGQAERWIESNEDLTPSLQVLLSKFVRIMLVTVALLAVLGSIGIDLTALTVFSGAVGVGIGFGLQKVVSNFVSGIIILMDKSIKPGDVISLGETFGWIRLLRGRYVSVVTRDGREYLIPNDDFITGQVVNWSFTDRLVRLDVPFGVSYGSDPHVVRRIAVDACKNVDRVSVDPLPVCHLTAFGDSSLDFLLRFWIADPEKGLTNIRGAVMLALWDAFHENGIKFPFPHRHLIVENPVPVEIREAKKPAQRGGRKRAEP
ncbi:mechanosensitive ion channel family protein [Microbaculum marinisediminis]|uniref:Mechanosensitive ion channel n=1 Tax=Microbaculum marinisediminis TaxID=2931392 RepID=A0AAW5QS34_9HYPH|nr:mechanosensitive ion channel domain-containing protein [Microbaculum sp. A6E488]MCT8970458.1 mechanosensitive ion channel [Microbaculum sp. A6E488]